MASFKLNWILSVTALVGCVVIGTAARRPLTREDLMLQWNHKSFDGEKMYRMFKEYGMRQHTIDEKTVGELIEMCTESLKNCLLRLPEERNSPLFRYAKYCKEERLKNFCQANDQSVLEMVLENIEGNKVLAEDFLKQLPEMGPEQSRLEDSDIKQAFWKFLVQIDSSAGPLSLPVKKIILSLLKSSLREFFDINFLADHYRKSQPEQPPQKEKPSLLRAYLGFNNAPSQQEHAVIHLDSAAPSSWPSSNIKWWKLMYASLDFERIAKELESQLS